MSITESSKRVLTGAADKTRADIRAMSADLGGVINQINELQARRDRLQAQIDQNTALLADIEGDIASARVVP